MYWSLVARLVSKIISRTLQMVANFSLLQGISSCFACKFTTMSCYEGEKRARPFFPKSALMWSQNDAPKSKKCIELCTSVCVLVDFI